MKIKLLALACVFLSQSIAPSAIADIDQEQSNVRFGEKQTSAQKAFGN
jgi:hypothetical protein